MDWIRTLLAANPEITFFVILGLGYLLGQIPLGRSKLGASTGTLVAGILVGQLGLTLPDEVRQCFFMLFLFASGFRTGPQVFRSLKKDGLQQGALAVIVGTVGLIAAYTIARIFHYDPGTGAGLLAGALTEDSALGTAVDAISRLPGSQAARAVMAENLPVAFAVTYVVGLTGAAWFLSRLAPRIMRVDLAEECRKLESAMQVDRIQPLSARRDYELRTFAIDPSSPWADRAVHDLEAAAAGGRIFVERMRRRGQLIDSGLTLLRAGDVIAVSGPRARLVDLLDSGKSGLREVDDRELLSVPIELLDVIVTNPAVDGRTLADLGREEAVRGVFLRRLTRGGMPISFLWQTPVRRGDVLTVVGSKAATARAVEYLGVADRPTDTTNMLVVATAIVAGALIGLPALHVGRVAIGLSLPVGVLFGGLVCGWLRSVRPAALGRVPGAALSVFESIGLTSFIGVVGLNAGPAFVRGAQMSGPSLVLAAAFTVTLALLVGVVVGRWVFRMHPGVVLGACAGACTATPALAAVQEAARSAVPTIGFGVAYAVGNAILAIWGTVIVVVLT